MVVVVSVGLMVLILLVWNFILICRNQTSIENHEWEINVSRARRSGEVYGSLAAAVLYLAVSSQSRCCCGGPRQCCTVAMAAQLGSCRPLVCNKFFVWLQKYQHPYDLGVIGNLHSIMGSSVL